MSDNETSETIPLETVSDVEYTLRDRVRELLNTYLIVPGRIIIDDNRTIFGGSVVLAYLLLGFVGPVFIGPTSMWDGPRLLGPFKNLAHPLGTDPRGRDIFKLIMYGTSPVLKMMASGAIFMAGVGTLIGAVSGFSRGRLGDVLSTITDIALTIPGLPLVIVLSVMVNPTNPLVVGPLVVINRWGGLARNIRSQVLAIREEPYIEASKAMGIRLRSIVLKDLLPNIAPYVMYNLMRGMQRVLFLAVGLYFLGVLPYNQSNWGVIVQTAYEGGALTSAGSFHWLFFPLVAIVLLSLALILIAQATDKIFNPQVRARHASSESESMQDI